MAWAVVRILLLIHCLVFLPLDFGGSSFGLWFGRELFAVFLMSCTVGVLWLSLTVPWVDLSACDCGIS